MVNAEITPPSAHTPPARIMAVRKPALKAAGRAKLAVVRPAAAGRTATAISPAARATALFTAEARPACATGAAARTVAVSGDTVRARPSAKTVMAGRKVVR